MLWSVRCVAAFVVLGSAVAAKAGTIAASTEEALFRGLAYSYQPYPQADGLQGFGCGFADLDGDGDPDVILLGATTGPGPTNGKVGIFENTGSGFFIDRSTTAGIPLLASPSGFAAADYDADGLIDLYITQMGFNNRLFRNLGGFHFTNVSNVAGVNDNGAGTGACFGDFDGDTRLDLYVCNYNGAVPGTELLNNRLYRNKGDGTFEEVGAAQGVDNPGYGFQAVWFDMDLDGDVDLYLSNDRGHLKLLLPNQLWRNDDGTLVNVSAGSGADLGFYSMGLACGDFDGNGLPDLYCTNLPNAADMEDLDDPLFLNQGAGLFVESGVTWGVNNPFDSWGAIFYDFDNNGHLDLFVNNEDEPDPNALHLNDGTAPCSDVAAEAGVTGLGYVSFASAVGDVDGDGDLDLLVNELDLGSELNVQLYINHEGDQRRWIKYRVDGLGENLHGVGARIETRTGTDWQLREVMAGGNGYLGQNELTVHVGLDDAVTADEVVVHWPGGAPTRTLTDLPSEETWTLYPPQRLGDSDGDGTVVLDDYLAFADCYAGGFGPGCEMMDFDGGSVIDLDDFDAFLGLYQGDLFDCNGNAQPDLLDILLDPGLDLDGNGILDACDAADIDGDGVVGIGDLLLVLGGWGPCPQPPAACPGDIDGDGTVGVADLLIVLGFWS